MHLQKNRVIKLLQQKKKKVLKSRLLANGIKKELKDKTSFEELKLKRSNEV